MEAEGDVLQRGRFLEVHGAPCRLWRHAQKELPQQPWAASGVGADARPDAFADHDAPEGPALEPQG
eukprot:3703726-Alexandrium_andersonii.AAC.1